MAEELNNEDAGTTSEGAKPELDVDAKLAEIEERYEKAIKAKEAELEKQYNEKSSKLEKRLAQIEDLSLDTKEKEKLLKLDEKEKQLEKESEYQKRLEKMEIQLKQKEHENTVKDFISKNPYLKGHIEHTDSKEELESLIKREGKAWEKLYAYENNNNNKNGNVTRGYNINSKNGNIASVEDKFKSWQETLDKFLPGKRKGK